jgi:hypothetical protein
VKRWCALGLLCAVSTATPARAQATGQAWTNVTIDWLRTNRLSYEVDFEPKAQLVVHEGQPTFGEMKAVPQVSYAVSRWVDLLGEIDLEYQAESNETNSMTMTPTIGANLHILSQILRAAGGHGADNERPPQRRADFGSLLRLEDVNTFYSTSALQKSMWRVRDRFGVVYPLNRPKVTDDGAAYVTSDAELFIPIDEDLKGGVVNGLRIRAGLGYRESFGWRYEVLYMWDGQRSAHSGAMAANFHAIDVRIKRVF